MWHPYDVGMKEEAGGVGGRGVRGTGGGWEGEVLEACSAQAIGGVEEEPGEWEGRVLEACGAQAAKVWGLKVRDYSKMDPCVERKLETDQKLIACVEE